MALVEHMIYDYGGRRLDQKHVNAYMSQGDTWIDIHISIVDFDQAKQPILDSILDSVRIEPA